ncbi:methyltransferase, FxLD system [Actinophytocola sediminis]
MTTNDDSVDSERATRVRHKVVDDLIAEGTIVSAQVTAAMRRVPRESFVPGVCLDDVYHPYNGVVIKRDKDGNSISSVSSPQLQAHMLEQAEITAGMRVLEIGSGGYNAALLAELVGTTGQVTTVDIDQDITDRASLLLARTGYPRVNVVRADAEHGVPEHAPYDRILVTAGVWDIPPAWVDQLTDRGRLVVPLSLRGLSRTIAFDRADGCLISRSSKLFGFVPIRGAGVHESTLLVMRGGEVTLRFDDAPPAGFNLDQGVLDTPRVEVWSGATIGRFEPWATAQMWLATVLPGFCRVVVDRERDTGLITPPGRHTAAAAAISGGNLAYVTTRDTADQTEVEFGVHAFGSHAIELAEEVAEQLRIWARDHRRGPGPQIRVYPHGTPDARLAAERVIDKKHSRITISWPQVAIAPAGQAVPVRPTE